MINIVRWLFEESGKKDSLALSSDDEKIDYKSLYSRILALSKKLSELGENKNIVLIADNSIFFVVGYFAIMGSGNVCIPLKYDKNIQLQKIIDKTGSDTIFIQKKYADIAKGSFKNIYTEEGVDFKDDNFLLKDYPDEKIASIMFTSGTTQEAKGVVITHKNLMTNTKDIIEGLSLTDKDKILVILPFYYCFGASLLHTHIKVGGELVLNNNFFLPQRILDELVDKRCTGIAGVPATYQILLRKTRINEMSFPSMRCVQQAGGKLTNQYLKELIQVFGKEHVFVMYGQTEATARLSILNPKFLDAKLGSIGKGLNSTELKVLSEEGNPVKPGEVGEIYAKGNNIMPGYYKEEEITKKKIINGMLKSGDFATVDEDGFIYIVDRQEDFIKTRGYRVSAKLVEETISQIHDIVEVAVVGVEDSIMGEKIVAYVSVNKPITEKSIIDYCAEKLQKHEVPSQVIFLSILPKNKSLKMDYFKLKKEYPQFLNDAIKNV